jgi:hypothetical protein
MPIYNYQLTAPGDQARCNHDDAGTIDSFFGNDDIVVIGRIGGAASVHTAGIVMPLDVPQGATINSATIQLYNGGTGQGATINARVYADANLTQANFGGADVPSAVSLTTAFGSITNPTAVDNTGWTAIDIASVITEIVSDPSWSQNDLIRFVVTAVSPSAYTDRRINGSGTYSNTSNEPAISVDYDVGGGASIVPIINHYMRLKK